MDLKKLERILKSEFCKNGGGELKKIKMKGATCGGKKIVWQVEFELSVDFNGENFDELLTLMRERVKSGDDFPMTIGGKHSGECARSTDLKWFAKSDASLSATLWRLRR